MEATKQEYKIIESSQLLHEVRDIKAEGYRLVQACATNVGDETELLYTFDKDFKLFNIKMNIPKDRIMESITGEYWGAFIYENEMNDLFGIKFKHSKLDFEGNFFVTKEETPWMKK